MDSSGKIVFKFTGMTGDISEMASGGEMRMMQILITILIKIGRLRLINGRMHFGSS